MKWKLLTTVALGAASLLWESGASANPLVEYSVDGGLTFTTICTAPSGTACVGATATPNGLLFNVQSAFSNSPGTTTLADLLSAALNITNTNHPRDNRLC